MCGIFGVLNRGKDKINPLVFRKAVSTLLHRGPDETDCYFHEKIALGHQRLSIFDVSSAGKQPFRKWNKAIVFNGAIYNFPELKVKLIDKGYQFDTCTDTEVLLAAYDYWGGSFHERLNGQWSFAIYNELDQSLFCSRDRFGIKPFYYTWIDGNFYFSSEVKAFLKVPNWKAILNIPLAYEFLNWGMHDHTEQTLFKNVFKLQGGHSLSLTANDTAPLITQYYDIRKIKPSPFPSEAAAITRFDELLENSIDLRLRADVPIGAALSGGLDSSSIVLSITSKQNKIDLASYSVIYPDKKISEEKYVQAVLDKADLEAAYRISPSYEELKELRRSILWHQEAPYNGTGVEAQFLMFQKVKDTGRKVILDGQGADEILGGYEKFYWALWQSKDSNILDKGKLIFDILARHRLPLKEMLYRGKNYFSKEKIPSSDFLKIKPSPNSLFKRAEEKTMLDMSFNLLQGMGLPALLRYEDKNAMAHGIESRVPFLDHHLVEYCLTLPDNFKIQNGIRKSILRKSRKAILPSQLLTRYDKLGFATPEEKWLKKDRESMIESIINNERLEGIIDFSKIKNNKDVKKVWRVYLLGEWMDLFDVKL